MGRFMVELIAMTKWEYALVRCGGGKFALLPDGSVHELGSDLRDILSLLNRMGTDCWEVVASAGENNSVTWTLKRPLP